MTITESPRPSSLVRADEVKIGSVVGVLTLPVEDITYADGEVFFWYTVDMGNGPFRVVLFHLAADELITVR